MPKETLNPTQSFPSFARWFEFVNQQDSIRSLLNRPRVRLRKTLREVVNSIEFQNQARSLDSPDYRPNRLTQNYYDPMRHFDVETTLSDTYLSNQLRITNLTDNLLNFIVSSQSYLSGGKWNSTQEIFLPLSEDYLKQLKDEKLVANNSRHRVCISRANDEITPTIEGGIGEAELPLSSDALKRICHDTGLLFEFNKNAKATVGTLGNISFTLQHARATALSPDKIWKVLTGTHRERFIFPVHVSGK